ncbi:MAG: restriction endonuclease subunit S [Prolixibacteraceae bacterium]|jgi:type I restriction enzyme, S subunit|nr:restriction endonuclease subunit S [Prolixibacteraceae bacterium]MBT6004479.1 restriction endonuclease subunit S [Prolixibacteraceae bacterium]MBT6763671.1 restriction endonuclease subunit S [Prolixibacteraceae bacterium]MBT6997230.1 restriction endonuclease subunit S [Prolixibacteraceae bacterium]MBT7396719.1 restriction endonuclease subunit S [Prolixibacteraceae bacterium]
MRSKYKKLGKYIQEVNNRNSELKVEKLLGVSIKKILMPSIANTVGTDMSTYKIIKRNQFAYGPVTSRNGNKISVALLEEFDKAIVSQAYVVFEIIDHNELLPEYLMMWFRRPEFDRYARFKSHGSARETFDWVEMCETELPVPSIEKQRAFVKEYNTIVNRIKLNEQLNQKLEETAQALYKHWFVENAVKNETEKKLGDLCSLITDGKHGDCENELNSGYYFVSVKDLSRGEIIYDNARQITKVDFEETHRRTNLYAGDILLTNAGTIGRMAIVKDLPETNKTTFQKSVAILKPKKDVAKTYFLYSLIKFYLKDIVDLAGGSTQSNLLLGDLRSFEIKYPSFDSVCEFEKKAIPIFQLMESKNMENQKLLKMRDLVLSKITKVETEKEVVEQ